MDMESVDRIYEALTAAIDGEEYDTIMIALGALHNTLAIEYTTDAIKLREIYRYMADSAVCMALIQDDEDSTELSAKEDSSQKERTQKTRKKAGDEPGPFGSH